MIVTAAAVVLFALSSCVGNNAPFNMTENPTSYVCIPDMESVPVDDSQTEPLSSEDAGYLYVEFIDVGQGDAILVYDEGGNTMLIDTGVYSMYNQLDAYLSEAGISKIDYLMLTHPDADHIGSADYILADYDVKQVLVPDCTDDTATYRYYTEARDNSMTEEVIVHAGDRFKLGDADITILAPDNENTCRDKNSHSVVAKLTYGESSFLFTGDLTGEETADIINAGYDVSADVYKVAHHGSANDGCNSQSFLMQVDPEYAVVSCGNGNRYGHPHEETVSYFDEADIPLFRTDENGTIYCRTDGHSYEWSCSKGELQ